MKNTNRTEAQNQELINELINKKMNKIDWVKICVYTPIMMFFVVVALETYTNIELLGDLRTVFFGAIIVELLVLLFVTVKDRLF